MNLILVRHGETDWNRIGRCQGFSDVELNENGKKQISELAKSLEREQISAAYSSDLRRACATANAIAGYHKLSVNIDPDLREMNQGDFEGLPFFEIRERYADVLKDWIENPESVRIPGGESLGEVQERAWRAIERIHSKYAEETILVVSHNLTITTLLCKFTGVPLKEFPSFKLQVTSKNVIVFKDGSFKVVLLNDTQHLKPELLTIFQG